MLRATAPPFKVVIPARFGATRLPGKPLATIAGQPLIARVIERARASAAEEVLVATDDPRIAAVGAAAGVEVVMTRADHASGSARIAEVCASRGWSPATIVVNLQGDEPCMPSALIDQVATTLAASGPQFGPQSGLDPDRPAAAMATLATPIDAPADLFDPNIVKLVVTADGHALYFSRAPIPWARDAFPSLGGAPPTLPLPTALPPAVPYLRHIGLYAYRAGFLARYVAWPAAPLECVESLEQLRVLWHGERIAVAIASTSPGPGIDTPDDIARAEAWLRQ